jgi:hypothetical protein
MMTNKQALRPVRKAIKLTERGKTYKILAELLFNSRFNKKASNERPYRREAETR